MNSIKRATLSSTILTGLFVSVIATPGFAATTPAVSDVDVGEIVVTARKTKEDILKVPVAVTALTGADIQARGIVSLNDIAANTPGLNILSNSSGRNDRSFQSLILRGFTPSSTLATTTSIFIDGVPVASSSALETVDDPERVEVLKGPQSAYFGRNTFAGAVNVVTKTPSDSFGGSVRGMVGTRSNYDVHADVEGPLLGDKLLFRATVRQFSKDGSYKNQANPGQTLGDQKTRSGTLELVAKPTESLTLKAFGLYTEDKDGPSAQGLISAYRVNLNNGVETVNGTGPIIVPGQSNCLTPSGKPFFCGTAPSLIAGFSPAQNTLTDAYIKNFLANPKGRLINPSDGVQGYGLKRVYYHLHFNIDYELADTGVTLSSLTGYNKEYYSELADLDNYDDSGVNNVVFTPGAAPFARSYFDFPFLVERKNRDVSQEFRASYDQHGPFRAAIGGSYLYNRVQGGLGGGNGALIGNGAPTASSTFSAVSGATASLTKGAFFSLAYDVTSQLTVDVDGRYQIDTLYAYAQPTGLVAPSSVFVPAGTYAGNALLLRKSFKNFLPRAIIQYKATPDLMAYASYSKGVNPGQFNTTFLTQSAGVQQAAANAGIGIGVSPEKLDNYEIGLKGKLLDNRIRFSLALYYAKWKNQINSILVNALDNNGTIQAVSGSANSGKLNMKGVELDTTILPVDHVTMNVSLALNDSQIKAFLSPSITAYTGITNFNGNQNPNTSKYSATVGGEYRNALAWVDDADWYGRGEFIYKSGTYADQANLVKTAATKRVNLRLGVDKGPVSIEGFVTNVFNNKAYTQLSVNGVFTPAFSIAGVGNSLIAGLPDLRTFGLKASYKF